MMNKGSKTRRSKAGSSPRTATGSIRSADATYAPPSTVWRFGRSAASNANHGQRTQKERLDARVEPLTNRGTAAPETCATILDAMDPLPPAMDRWTLVSSRANDLSNIRNGPATHITTTSSSIGVDPLLVRLQAPHTVSRSNDENKENNRESAPSRGTKKVTNNTSRRNITPSSGSNVDEISWVDRSVPPTPKLKGVKHQTQSSIQIANSTSNHRKHSSAAIADKTIIHCQTGSGTEPLYHVAIPSTNCAQDDYRLLLSASSLGSNAEPHQSQKDVFFINGMKVTPIDRAMKIYVADMLTPDVCDLIVRLANQHVDRMEQDYHDAQLRHLPLPQQPMSGSSPPRGLPSPPVTWRKLYSYTELDLPCCEVSGMTEIIHHLIYDVTTVIGGLEGNLPQARCLHPRSINEPHLLKYQNLPDLKPHKGIQMHYDGSNWTFSLMLSDCDDYTGGGTYFRCMRQTYKLQKGQVLIHPGDLYHKGIAIQSGIRILLVCFMDGFPSGVCDRSPETDESDELEANVVIT